MSDWKYEWAGAVEVTPDPLTTGIPVLDESDHPVCADCGDRLFFSRRMAAAVLCGPCGRREAGTSAPADIARGLGRPGELPVDGHLCVGGCLGTGPACGAEAPWGGRRCDRTAGHAGGHGAHDFGVDGDGRLLAAWGADWRST